LVSVKDEKNIRNNSNQYWSELMCQTKNQAKISLI